MALINCPECNKEISDSAKSCPNCGFNIGKYLAAKNKRSNNIGKIINNEHGKIKTLLLMSVIPITFLIIIVIIAIIPRHEWIEADCTNPVICSDCKKTKGKALGHDFSEATCTEPQICTRCGEKQGKPLGHNYGEYTVVTEPTCLLAGRKTAVCAVCGNTDIQRIDQLPHTAGEWVVITEPTFMEDGENAQYCDVCQSIIKTEKTSLPAGEKEMLFKNACTTFTYENYARNPDAVDGELCKSYGKVAQAILRDDGKTFDIRVNLTKAGSVIVYWEDDVWVVYTKNDDDPNILEGDFLTFYGVASGTHSYETVSAGTRTVPLIFADYVDIGEDNTKTQKPSNQSSESHTTSDSSKFSMSADVFCQEEQGLYVKFVGVNDPAGRLQPNYVEVKFLVTNNNDSTVRVLMKGFTINDCSFTTSGGAAEIAAGGQSFLGCDVKKDLLSDYGIESIDKLSGYFWISGIGYTDTFTIDTK